MLGAVNPCFLFLYSQDFKVDNMLEKVEGESSKSESTDPLWVDGISCWLLPNYRKVPWHQIFMFYDNLTEKEIHFLKEESWTNLQKFRVA